MKQIIQENLPTIINWAGAITVLILIGIGFQKCSSTWEDSTRVQRQFYIDNGYVHCFPIAKEFKEWVKPEQCATFPIK